MDDSRLSFPHAISIALEPLGDACAQSIADWHAVDCCDSEEMEAAEQKYAHYREHDVPCRLLTAAELTSANPTLLRLAAGSWFQKTEPFTHRSWLDVARRAERWEHSSWLVERSVPWVTAYAARRRYRITRSEACLCAGCRTVSLGLSCRSASARGTLSSRSLSGLVHRQLVELGYLKSAHSSTSDSVAFNVQRCNRPVAHRVSRQFGAEHSGIDQHILSAMLPERSLLPPSPLSRHSRLDWLRAATPDSCRSSAGSRQPTCGWPRTRGLGITLLWHRELLACASPAQRPPFAEPYLPAD